MFVGNLNVRFRSRPVGIISGVCRSSVALLAPEIFILGTCQISSLSLDIIIKIEDTKPLGNHIQLSST